MKKSLIVLLCLLILSFMNPEKVLCERLGGVYRFPLRFTVKSLDPAQVTDISSGSVIQQIFDGLVQYDKNLNVVPAIARSWIISQDGTLYVFYLHKGVRFHNGREVTAEDFVYSFHRILDPRVNSPGAPLFSRIKGAEAFRRGETDKVEGLSAPERYVLRIELDEPFAPFLSILAIHYAKVVPGEEVEKGVGVFAENPCGTGPFRFVRWIPNKELVIESNEDYFEGRPYLDKVIYKIYPGAKTEIILQDFWDGKLESARLPSEGREKILQNISGYNLVRRPLLSLFFYGLNNSSPVLSDRKIRQALNLAIDKDEYVNNIAFKKYYKAGSILPFGMPGHDPKVKGYEYDPEMARRLLAEARPSNGPIRLNLISTSQSQEAQRDLEFIKKSLNEVGVDVEVEYVIDWGKFEERLTKGKFDIFRYEWYADYPQPDNFLATLFSSSSRYNFMRYRNQEVDELLKKANAEQDYLKRISLYRKVDDRILNDAPIIPIYYEILEELFQPYVRGIELTGLGLHFIPMKKIWLEK